MILMASLWEFFVLNGAANSACWGFAVLSLIGCLLLGFIGAWLTCNMLGVLGTESLTGITSAYTVTTTRWRSGRDKRLHDWILNAGVVVGAIVGIALPIYLRCTYFSSPYQPGMTMEQCKELITEADARIWVKKDKEWVQLETRSREGWRPVPEEWKKVTMPVSDKQAPMEVYQMRDKWHGVDLYFDNSKQLVRIEPRS